MVRTPSRMGTIILWSLCMAFSASGSGVSMPQKIVTKKASRIFSRISGRLAFFVTIFCGIETPDPDALKAMHKDHNMMVPILEGVRTINSYGMEVVSGIIMGLDTDKPETADALLAFIEQSR